MRILTAAVLFGVLSEGCALSQTKVAPSFDVTVVKAAAPDEPGKGWNSDNTLTKITNYTLVDLILRAYNLKSEAQVVSAPEWAGKAHYDLTAKMSPEVYRRQDALPRREKRTVYFAMLQSTLADRFGLHVELSTQRMPRFALVRVTSARMGPALKVTPVGPDGEPVGGSSSSSSGYQTKVDLSVSGLSMADIADRLSGTNETGHRVVVNQTGLSGFYSFQMAYAPDNGMGVSPDAILPGLMDTLRDELGLKLVKEESDVPVVVVTAAQQPELD